MAHYFHCANSKQCVTIVAMEKTEKETLKQKLENHKILVRLFNNPNWEPAARAAVAYLIDGKSCPVQSWKRSSTWQQVQMAFDEITGEGKAQ